MGTGGAPGEAPWNGALPARVGGRAVDGWAAPVVGAPPSFERAASDGQAPGIAEKY